MKAEYVVFYVIVTVVMVGIVIAGTSFSKKFATEVANRQQAAAAILSDEGVVK